MPETIFVGLDLGSSRCQQTIMGADGMVRFSRVIPTSEQNVRLAFDKPRGDVARESAVPRSLREEGF